MATQINHNYKTERFSTLRHYSNLLNEKPYNHNQTTTKFEINNRIINDKNEFNPRQFYNKRK